MLANCLHLNGPTPFEWVKGRYLIVLMHACMHLSPVKVTSWTKTPSSKLYDYDLVW